MSQKAFLQQMDSDVMNAMVAAGMADTGVYLAPAGSPVSVRCYVDDAAAFFGTDAMPVAGARVVIGLLLAEVPAPVRDATVTIGADVYTLDSLVAQDQSISRWVVS
ncbi:MAG: hypothetical protein JSS23_09270 [Proteobacteria bacterium]|nr:hypothetical protein [Pseudomonadota bacterium]